MSRFAQADYLRLKSYFESYRFSDKLLIENEQVAKNIHKNTLCAIQVWAGISRAVAEECMILGGVKLQQQSMQRLLLDEFFSDIVTSAFSAYHGLYKPSHVTLRSAIEVIIRAGAGNLSEEALGTRSVFRLFEIAAECGAYAGSKRDFFMELKTSYGELCGYVHTATPGHMARVYAFADFPAHDSARLTSFAGYHRRIVIAALSILIEDNPIVFTAMPPRARDMLEDVLPAGPRLRALGKIED